MAVENANVVQAMAQFTTDDGGTAPVLGRADGVTGVTRVAAGRFKCALLQKVVAGQVNCHVSSGQIASPGALLPYWIVDADGDIEVITRNVTVNADFDALMYLTVLRFPTIA